MALTVSKIDKLLELFSSSEDEQLEKIDEHDEENYVPECIDKDDFNMNKIKNNIKWCKRKTKPSKHPDKVEENIKMVELEIKPIMIQDSDSDSEPNVKNNDNNTNLFKSETVETYVKTNECFIELSRKSNTTQIIGNSYVYEERNEYSDADQEQNILEIKRSNIKKIVKQQTDNIKGETKIKKNRTQVKRNLRCKECNKKMKNEQFFLLHMQIHENRKETECVLCSKEFKDVNTVLEHYASFDKNKNDQHYVKMRPFPCHLCDLRYKNRKHLTDHLDIHAGQGKYLCPICGKRFFKGFNMTIHLKVHEKSYHSCDRCNKKFRNDREYQAHQRNIHGENNITCTICNRAFSRRNNMKKHMETHGRVYNQCILCNTNYEFRRDFNQHMREVHNRIKKYTCSICGKIFSLHCKLTRHLETHNRIKDNCVVCEKEFRNRRDYNAHMRNMHGVITGSANKESKNDSCKMQFKIIHDVQVGQSGNVEFNDDVKINIKIDINDANEHFDECYL